MNNISKKPKKTIPLNSAQEKLIADKVYSVFKNGTPLYKVCGISKQKMENLYAAAYNLYSAEKYQEAGKIFQIITLYNYTDKKSWLGAAGSAEMLKKYDKAILAYVIAARLDKFDPVPILHAFDCHLALKNYPEALRCLETVILRCSKKKEYEDIRKRAESLRDILHKIIQESKTIS
ncbi:MAG: SycD/LcrH family type III secretion system chaperone [Chthoniobacterales bacterium]|nr:SycD/LcrH family type III secretion system chaperone [Chthoniobacterales bacterium]